jgi:hypothetical protein
MIAFRVREKGMMGRIVRIMNDVIGDGHFEDVLEVDFWGRIRKMRVYRRDVGLDWKLRVVKRVRIGSLYRKWHGDWSRVVWEGGGMMEGRVVVLCGCCGCEWTGERVRVVGEGGPVEGGGGVDDGSGRGGRHRTWERHGRDKQDETSFERIEVLGSRHHPLLLEWKPLCADPPRPICRSARL